MGGAPLTLGTPGVGASGREFNVSLLQFFLTEPAFIDLNGHESKAQIIEPTGQPSPYALHLVNADEPETQVLRLTAPAGNYAAFHLGIGVPAACNALNATRPCTSGSSGASPANTRPSRIASSHNAGRTQSSPAVAE